METDIDNACEFRLFDLAGALLMREPLTPGRTSIGLRELTPGVYLWQVFANGGFIGSGRARAEW